MHTRSLFDVRRFGDVLQMTSTIGARLRSGATLADIFDAIYPCGSITGAPRSARWDHPREVEQDARGLPSADIGWFVTPPEAGSYRWNTPGQPEKSGAGRDDAHPAGIGNFCLSVPIRTLTLEAPDGQWFAMRRTRHRFRHRVR